MKSQAEIQLQQIGGQWVTYSRTELNDIVVTRAMNDLKQSFPDQAVRAIDSKTGSILNILPAR